MQNDNFTNEAQIKASNKNSKIKTIIVTGATSGIGFYVCRELLKQNSKVINDYDVSDVYDENENRNVFNSYDVIGIGHSKENSEKAEKQLKQEFPKSNVTFFYGDLMQQSEVKRISSELSKYLDENCDGKLYALINNAGCVRSWYSTTEDGYEQQFALNHLTGFLLTHYLLNYLKKGKGRVLMTSSASHKMMKMHWKDIMYKKRYRPLMVYKQSKLCNMLFAYAFNERFVADGVRAYGIDPGLVKTEIGLKQTGGIVKLVWSLRMKSGVSPEIPAKTYSYVCLREPTPKGLYYYLCKKRKYNSQVNKENADRLFLLSEKLCGITFGEA